MDGLLEDGRFRRLGSAVSDAYRSKALFNVNSVDLILLLVHDTFMDSW
jgi:hypothetical protein